MIDVCIMYIYKLVIENFVVQKSDVNIEDVQDYIKKYKKSKCL